MSRAKAAHPDFAVLRDEHSIAPHIVVGGERPVGKAVRAHRGGIFLDQIRAGGERHGERIKDEGPRIKGGTRRYFIISPSLFRRGFSLLSFSLHPLSFLLVALKRGFA